MKRIISFLICILIMISVAPKSNAEVYISNHPSPNITFEMNDEPTETEQIVWDFLYAEFDNPIVVCAIMGNMFKESKVQAWIYEGDWSKNDQASKDFVSKINAGLQNPTEETKEYFMKWVPFPGFEGFGLIQFTCHIFKESLYERAINENRKIDDPILQCEEIVWWTKNYYTDMYKTMNTTNDLWKAVLAFANEYEKCQPGAEGLEVRLQAAEHYWYMFYEQN